MQKGIHDTKLKKNYIAWDYFHLQQNCLYDVLG